MTDGVVPALGGQGSDIRRASPQNASYLDHTVMSVKTLCFRVCGGKLMLGGGRGPHDAVVQSSVWA